MAHGESGQLLLLCNLIATAIWISLKFETSVALERPYHLAICVLGLSGVVCLVLERLSGSDEHALDRKEDGNEDDNAHAKLESANEEQQYPGSRTGRILRFLFQICGGLTTITTTSVILVTCIVLRALTLRKIVRSVECSSDGVETFLPIVYCLLELLTKAYRLPSILRLEEGPKPSRFYNLRYVLLVATLSVSAYGIIFMSTDHSTYICPEANHSRAWIRTLQVFGVFLDAIIINLVSNISKEGHGSTKQWYRLGQVALASLGALILVACLCFFWPPSFNYIRRDYHGIFFPNATASLAVLIAALLGTNLVFSAVYLLAELRSTTLVVLATFVFVYMQQFSSSTWDYSFIPNRTLNWPCLIAFAAFFGLVRMEREATKAQFLFSMNQKTSKFISFLCLLLGAAFCWKKYFQYSTATNFSTHPIAALISNARSTSLNWEEQASRSTTLSEAVNEYQARYGIPPPPHFDKWWDYATARNSVIKDDFNQIHEDLLPFWGMNPSEIRYMTAHMIERPWTEVAGLRISNGTTTISPHFAPTHRWMVEGAADMINKFSEWLPDMDLAFNINDENRVAVPWQDMQDLKAKAKIFRRQLNQTKTLKTFSEDREWADAFMAPEPPYPSDLPSPYFEEASMRSSFTEYGVMGCPPNSPSKWQTWWSKSTFCHDCAKPHSIGPILSNWTLSGSLCHQPDLANLHGFHLSPSSFKPTKKPFPIFSQSKIQNFNDIIFPSPWNYRDKVVYDSNLDMPYTEKAQSVFWRGATSEGYAIRGTGTWQGMQRQRFVHLMNYTAADSHINLLVRSSDKSAGYIQQATTIEQISSVTNISVSFVGEPTRCWDTSCWAETKEFSFGPGVDFQDHWKYKFLFDFDGAGFSGRFLPFLQSRSLVFRAASFRQWFDERLVAWRHFVPVDTRLHGVWHLIAYFGGTDRGVNFGNEDGHEREAKMIAEDGKEWAERVLRKEDMEVYMFRLLLEWGRIVDNRREELGFVLT